MSKFSPRSRLPKAEEQELLLDFFRSLGTMRGFKEAAEVFQDLLSRAELTMLAKRLKIAKLLLQGIKYQEISRQLKVSSQTIARVNVWLQESGDGFRLMMKRTKKSSTPYMGTDGLWSHLRRNYPLHHWPEIVVKEIVRMANRKQKERLYSVLQSLQRKGKLSRDLQKLLH